MTETFRSDKEWIYKRIMNEYRKYRLELKGDEWAKLAAWKIAEELYQRGRGSR